MQGKRCRGAAVYLIRNNSPSLSRTLNLNAEAFEVGQKLFAISSTNLSLRAFKSAQKDIKLNGDMMGKLFMLHGKLYFRCTKSDLWKSAMLLLIRSLVFINLSNSLTYCGLIILSCQQEFISRFLMLRTRSAPRSHAQIPKPNVNEHLFIIIYFYYFVRDTKGV